MDVTSNFEAIIKIVLAAFAALSVFGMVIGGAIVYEYRDYRKSREIDNKERRESAVLAQKLLGELQLAKSQMLTKDQHDDICTKRQEEIGEKLDAIQGGVDRMGEKFEEFDASTGKRLAKLETQIAVSKALDERRREDVARALTRPQT